MQISNEVRWFFSSENDLQPFKKWFEDLPYKLSFSNDGSYPRQDYYMKLPKIMTFGIKLREPKVKDSVNSAKLEPKLLLKDHGVKKFSNNNSGKTNEWVKFSFDIMHDSSQKIDSPEFMQIINSYVPSADLSTAGNKEHWIKVDKDRMLVKFDAGSGNIVDANIRVDDGCGIELTKIRIGEKKYYSLGLESFSTNGKHSEVFDKAVTHLFNSIKVSGLSEKNSMSYPELLSSI